MRNLIAIRFAILLGGVSVLLSDSVQAEAPFVSGYDRFAAAKTISESQAGQLLLTELSCTACHTTDSRQLDPKGGPDLTGVGSRVNQKWLRAYLSAPHLVKPGTTMPEMMAGLSDTAKEAALSSLVAFLSSQRLDYPEVKAGGASPVPYQFWKKGNAELGKGLYHRIGCVACHEPDPDYETAEYKPTPLDQMIEQLDDEELKELGFSQLVRPVKSVPHGDLSKKYSDKSLTYFLMNPENSRPAGRMPNFKLAPMEAAHIAAYLGLKDTHPPADLLLNAESELIMKGRQAFIDLKCTSCHQVKGLSTQSSAKKLSDLTWTATQSCVGSPTSNLPHFELTEQQVNSLKVAAKSLQDNESMELQSELNLRMLQLNCYACHERDERGGVGRNRKAYLETVRHIDLGDEGRIPPPLTGVGQKLTQGWLKKVLDGSGVVRPHLSARMPQFPATQVKSLPSQFAIVDDFQKQDEAQVFGDTKQLASAGRMLLDTGCVQCHPVKGEALPGVVGVDLSDVTSRIHPAWFQKFLLDPGEVKPRTRMPTFFPNGKSSNQQVLNGDVDLQIASLWAYLKDLKNQPLPEKILTARSQSFELVPEDKPIVIRTFMKEAGTHAIAVGFPEKIHIAYDAEQVRLAEIWTGKFLDAQGTWYERFAPPAIPLGESHHSLPAGASLTLSESTPRFRGYRLEESGHLIFLFRLANCDVEEQIFATNNGRLRRLWTFRSREKSVGALPLSLHLLSGGNPKHLDPTTLKSSSGIKVTLLSKHEAKPTPDGWQLVLPDLTAGKTFKIEVEYQW